MRKTLSSLSPGMDSFGWRPWFETSSYPPIELFLHTWSCGWWFLFFLFRDPVTVISVMLPWRGNVSEGKIACIFSFLEIVGNDVTTSSTTVPWTHSSASVSVLDVMHSVRGTHKHT